MAIFANLAILLLFAKLFWSMLNDMCQPIDQNEFAICYTSFEICQNFSLPKLQATYIMWNVYM